MNTNLFMGAPVTAGGKRVGTVIDAEFAPGEKEKLDAQMKATQAALGSLAEVAAGPKQNKAARGPRNLPQPDARKVQRQRVRAARRANR